MKSIRIILVAIFALVSFNCLFFAEAKEPKEELPKLIVFHSPSCHRCVKIKNEVMPQIEEHFLGKINIEYFDISDIENYKYLLSLKEKYNSKIPNDLPVFFMEGRFLNGSGNVEEGLRRLIFESKPSLRRQEAFPLINLIEHFKSFKPLAVASAGLIDGINPCAFTVIVFFISFLALQGYRKRALAAIGLAFVFAVFLTYLLIGLGIFNFLYRLKGFFLAARFVNYSIAALSILLGFFAVYDHIKFRKTKDTEGLLLQLPKVIKDKIHSIIGLYYRRKGQEKIQEKPALIKLIISAFVTGFLISILEAVCTGQVYLPTISFVLKTTQLKFQAFSYLLLYNLMFIVPLLIIFLFALLGATSQDFAKFLKRHLGLIKMLMAVLFFGLGIFLFWRG